MINSRIRIIKANIVTLEVDAIVNAANTSLLGGGGVDGAIHRAAGSELVEECRMLHGCKVGEAKITKGYRLPAKYVIHTVGPKWNNGISNEEDKLASCYQNGLTLARDYDCRTVAFPAISTGIYGFPHLRAAEIALQETAAFLEANELPEQVFLICFDPQTIEVYTELTGNPPEDA